MQDQSDEAIQKDETSELIRLLEAEMGQSIKAINVPKDKEESIDYQLVQEWYLNAEKLIRVFANVLGQPLHQSINQLRYAGHHIINYCASSNSQQSDLIEAYKHCKRSVYDAFDTYVFSISQRYTGLLPLLEGDDVEELDSRVSDFIERITKLRSEADKRIDYYSEVQKNVIAGLQLIEDLNKIIRKTGIPQLILEDKKNLLEELAAINNRNVDLEVANERLEASIGKNSHLWGKILSWTGIILTIIIVAISSASSVFFDSNHNVTIYSPAHDVEDQKSSP